MNRMRPGIIKSLLLSVGYKYPFVNKTHEIISNFLTRCLINEERKQMTQYQKLLQIIAMRASKNHRPIACSTPAPVAYGDDTSAILPDVEQVL